MRTFDFGSTERTRQGSEGRLPHDLLVFWVLKRETLVNSGTQLMTLMNQVNGTVSDASGRNVLNPSALSPRQPYCIIVSPHQRATEMFWPLFGDLSRCMLKFQLLVHLDNNVRGTVCPKKTLNFLHFLQVCLLSGLMFT